MTFEQWNNETTSLKHTLEELEADKDVNKWYFEIKEVYRDAASWLFPLMTIVAIIFIII